MLKHDEKKNGQTSPPIKREAKKRIAAAFARRDSLIQQIANRAAKCAFMLNLERVSPCEIFRDIDKADKDRPLPLREILDSSEADFVRDVFTIHIQSNPRFALH